jgi:DNA-binding NarL/FixJ family response regulator
VAPTLLPTVLVGGAVDSRPRVVVAAENALFGDGLRTLLKASRRFRVIHNSNHAIDALQRTRELKPDVLVLDLALLPESLDLREAAASLSPAALLVLTTSLDRAAIQPLIDVGTRGVVLKDARAHVLVRAIRAIVDGQLWVDRGPVTDLPQALQRLESMKRQRHFGLTNRECEIVAAIAEAYTNKDIAQRFEISETTVKHHLTNIFDKVGVSTRLELAMFAVSHGLQVDSMSSLVC